MNTDFSSMTKAEREAIKKAVWQAIKYTDIVEGRAQLKIMNVKKLYKKNEYHFYQVGFYILVKEDRIYYKMILSIKPEVVGAGLKWYDIAIPAACFLLGALIAK